MTNLISLTKILFKTNVLMGTDGEKTNKKKSKFASGLLIALLLVFVGGSLGVPIVMTLDSILSISPLENIFISLILPLAGLTTIMFSVFSVVSVFYLSKDSEYLLSLPLSAKDIMMSKFLVSLVTEYYILVMFILPCLIGVGVGINAGAMYYVFMSVVFLLLPIIPSAIVALAVLLISRITGILKNKDLFMYISMFLIVAFALAYNFAVQEFISIDPENIGTTFGSLEQAVLPKLQMIFPFYNSASDALINYGNINGIFSLITFVVINFAVLLVVYLVGDKLYLKTLISNSGSKKKHVDMEKVVKCKKRSVVSELLKKEWLIIKRTPSFMLNIVVIIFLMPIIFISSFAVGLSSGGADTLGLSPEMVNGYLDNSVAYLIVLVVCAFFTSFSVAASTSISREGSNAWVMKAIPVSAFKQVNVKVLFASILDFIGVVIVAIIPVVMFEIPLYYVACVLVPITLLIFILNYFNIYLDLKKPKIRWSEDVVAVKQNMNALFSILFTFAVSAILGIAAYFIYDYKININVVVLSGIITFVCVIILTLIICAFKANEKNLLKNVD